jgi:hypothetical protein
MNTPLNLSLASTEQAVRDLKNFDLITAIDKAHVLLVMHDVKPSMHTGFFSDPVEIDLDLPKAHIEDKKKFGDIITDLGLSYKLQTKLLNKQIDNVSFRYEWAVFCVAKEINVAEALYDARERQDERHEGMLLGYPESAVDAYVNDDMIDTSDVPKLTENVDLAGMKFLNHRLSKNNWREEVKYLSDYARALKRIDTELYKDCISL